MLEVTNLSISFTQYEKGMRQKTLNVVSNLSITINPGKILAIVGSSGSGKSLLAHSILGILPKNAKIKGSIKYKGEELTPKLQEKLRGKEITLIPQSVNYLNPLMQVGAQVGSSRKKEALEKQKKIFKRYSLPNKVGSLFPFQLSGGMARRVLVASAVAEGAKLVIADEPTPGLHPEVAKETLSHLRELADHGSEVMLITHDIATAVDVADDIAVFYAGTTIEVAPARDFTGKGELLRHPYTKALWNALPQNEFTTIAGLLPSQSKTHLGCIFYTMCPIKSEACLKKQPEMRDVRNGKVRCSHAT